MQNIQRYKEKDAKLFEAVRRLQTGDDSGTNDVYELSEKYIYKIINDIVKNHQTTEDLMQETYLQVYNKIETLQNPEAFYVWAGRIATNLTLRHIQKYQKEVLVVADEEGSTEFVFESAAADQEAFIPENVLDNKETQRLIAAIIDSLSVEQKLSVQYFYYEEMSVKEIAEAMGCSEGTVKSRLNYARKSIKEAVIDLEVKEGTRLYSLASMPLFLLVFRAGAEELILGAVAAAGVVSAGTVAAVGGNAGAVGAAGAVAGESVAAGSIGTAGAGAAGVEAVGAAGAAAEAGAIGAGSIGSAGAASGMGVAGTVGAEAAAVGTAAGSSTAGGAAAGIGAKILGTTAGKAVMGLVTAAAIGGGAFVATNMQQESLYVTYNTDTYTSEYRESGEKIVQGSITLMNMDKESPEYLEAIENQETAEGSKLKYTAHCVGYDSKRYLEESGGSFEGTYISEQVDITNKAVFTQDMQEMQEWKNTYSVTYTPDNWLYPILREYVDEICASGTHNATDSYETWKLNETTDSEVEEALGLSDISEFDAPLQEIVYQGEIWKLADIKSAAVTGYDRFDDEAADSFNVQLYARYVSTGKKYDPSKEAPSTYVPVMPEEIEIIYYNMARASALIIENHPDIGVSKSYKPVLYHGEDKAYQFEINITCVYEDKLFWELDLESPLIEVWEGFWCPLSYEVLTEGGLQEDGYHPKLIEGGGEKESSIIFSALYPYYQKGMDKIPFGGGEWTEGEGEFIGFPEEGIEFEMDGCVYRIYDIEQVLLYTDIVTANVSETCTGGTMQLVGKIEIVSKGN